MPKVSIILPVYNVEKYIAKSIESVLNQTYKDFELLVIIDGSPDKSIEVAQSFEDDRIKIFEKENGGLSDARNYGLERANGEYIYFIDSDDWIEPNLLEDNIKLLEDEDLNFVIFGYKQDDEDINGNVLSSKSIHSEVLFYKKGDKDLVINSYQLGIMGYAWNKIYRKSFLDQHHFKFQKGISLVEDILFNAPIYQVSSVIRFNQKCYYHYINRDVETLMKKFYPNAFELKVMKNIALEDFLKEWEVENYKSILARTLFGGIKFCVDNIYTNSKGLCKRQRKENIHNIINHPRFIEYSTYLDLKTFKDKIYYKALTLNNDALMKILKFKR